MSEFHRYRPDQPAPEAIVVKLYHSGPEIRGYVRKIAAAAEDDTIFPGEEMEPEKAFRLAREHSEGEAPIYVELTEGVRWQENWGQLL
ncbi:hypothetical protein [Rhizobium paknamense]|uniref:Uncharacterized protein n=1 Tax=Rhizobium paknamense TaxID=1206817 RepID=A0ABU0IFZ5_9HYPH|nr:hypothetical protein [Rhizobium paknamense]MDQ0457187.1 hypothetical protein [Rhizobium paknamense]